MEHIINQRKVQPFTLEDFIANTIDNPKCKYCAYYNDCKEALQTMDADAELENYGCASFDNTFRDLKDIYINEYVKVAP